MTQAKKVLPKGGRKGGAVFPRLALKEALVYGKKLVTKTHTGPLAKDLAQKGIFGNSGPLGGVRASALRQYGLLDTNEVGHYATELAKQIVAAPEDEQQPLLQTACLKPSVFKALHDTFHSDTVTRAKIRQQALTKNVHPDAVEDCITFFIESLVTAKLATIDGENVKIDAVSQQQSDEASGGDDTPPRGEEADTETDHEEERGGGSDVRREDKGNNRAPRAVIQVNVTLDSSLDTEKLEKQLSLLRKYGAI
jgi:hypothetical protein